MNKISLLVFIIIEGILAIYLGDAFWKPARYVYTYGGDGAFIYFNMIYQTFFGDGFLLENMNYPKGESIFMTDAQASISLVFSKLHDIIPGIFTPDRIVGWTHRFHYLMIGVAGIYAFKTLELFKVKRLISVPSSVLIVLLSPMIIRLAAGHFGLAYPFVFAFTFFFLCQFYIKKKISLVNTVTFGFVMLFFGLNNFYVGMINLTFTLLLGLFMVIDSEKRKQGIKLLTYTISIVLLLYFAIHFTDPGMDRIEIQWGYLNNSVDISSFLYPPTSLLNTILSKFIHVKTHGGETWINLGLTSILILLTGIPFIFLKKLKHIKIDHKKLFIGLVLSSFVMLLYASAIFYRIPFLRDAFFHKISTLTMFKASARFAWPIYFVASFAAVYLLQEALLKLSKKTGYVVLGIVFLIWGIETHQYLDEKAFTTMHQNPYSQQSKEAYLSIVDNSGIDLDQYQALYSVPLMEGWNDKYHIVPNFQAEYNSILFSMSTGLPMINGMLSRIGVSDAAESIQLSSHPMIKKVKPSTLDNTKDILLVYGKDAENLSEGEQFLIDKSSLVTDQGGYQLRTLKVSDLKTNYLWDSIVTADLSPRDLPFHIYEHFDENETDIKFAGIGSKEVIKDEVLLHENLSDSLSGEYEASIYVHLSNEMYGQPQFHIDFLNVKEEIIETVHFNSYKSKDIDNMWIRASINFKINSDARKIKLYVDAINQRFTIDEFCLRPQDSAILHKNEHQKEILYNNYRWGDN